MPRVLAAKKPGDYFPLTKGSTWKYQGEGNEYASFTREVLFIKGNQAQIRGDNGGTVSAIVFKTMARKVKITGQDSTLYEYFKEGMGMVKREFVSGDTRVTSSLEKYTIK